MSNASIQVEFLAGTGIEDAIKEAKQLAATLDVAYVDFSFNGAHFSIGRNADVSEAVKEYHITHGKPYGITHA